jgi:hypothetical protein
MNALRIGEVRISSMRALMSLLLALALWVAILDDGSGDGGPPDPLPPIETDV